MNENNPQLPSGPANGENDHALALRACEGVGIAPDWEKALDYTLLAAESGHSLARATLAGLAGDWPRAFRLLAGESLEANYQTMRAAIDIASWKRAPRPRILSAAPRVALIEQIAPSPVCDFLIERARPGLIAARVYDLDTGGPAVKDLRTNSERYFPHGDRDLIFNLIRARMASATTLPLRAMEAPTILHYTAGQQFMPHHDYLDPAAPGYARAISERGQRVLTCLICLNDDYEGGETSFPLLGKRFKGKKGNALFFWNVTPEGAIDPDTLHAGLPPTSGEKWMLSQWIRDRDWPDA